MDLHGIPKRSARARLIECYQALTGNEKLPKNEKFFTLGGLSVVQAPDMSELDYLSKHRKFLTPEQYVSVENNRKRHEANSKIRGGATWICGEYERELDRYYNGLEKSEIGILNPDLMSGAKVALPILLSSLRTIASCRKVPGIVLISLNIIKYELYSQVMRKRVYDDPVLFLKNSAELASWYKKGLTLHDIHPYENKTIGSGPKTLMQTFTFTYEKKE